MEKFPPTEERKGKLYVRTRKKGKNKTYNTPPKEKPY